MTSILPGRAPAAHPPRGGDDRPPAVPARGAALSRTTRALTWVVLLSLLSVVTATVAVPALAGAQTYTVLTGSMRPGIPEGSVVVVRPAAAEDVAVGDVVTYQLRSDEPTVITHRVVARRTDAGGETLLRTRGDANDVADRAWVRPVQLRGTVWYDVPLAGRVGRVLPSDLRAVATTSLGIALLGYAVLLFARAAQSAARRSDPDDD